jgi:hypothetical protein
MLLLYFITTRLPTLCTNWLDLFQLYYEETSQNDPFCHNDVGIWTGTSVQKEMKYLLAGYELRDMVPIVNI